MSEDVLNELADLAARSSAKVYLVGGYLRDRLLGREPVDIDLLVEGNLAPFLTALSRKADFEPVIFSRKEPVTYRVALGEWLVDVSSCRPGGLKEAMERRDFTINALAAPLKRPGLDDREARLSPVDLPIDLLGGLADMRAHRIHHVSGAGLDEDPVRMLRAIRLAVILEGFTLDPALRDEIRNRSHLIATAPAERILAEMEVILACPRAGAGLRMMAEVGLLHEVFPALAPLAGLKQNRWHRYDALEHTLRAVEEADLLQGGHAAVGIPQKLGVEDAEVLKWAAVFHDTGKAAAMNEDDQGEVHFYGHETISAEIAREALASLRVGARKIARVGALIANHLRLPLMSSGESVSEKALRRLVHQLKYDTPLLCLLALADRRAGGGPDFEARLARLEEMIARVMHVLQSEGERVISPAPLLTGHEVMEILGIPPGPRVGAVLLWLTRMQVEERIKQREQAIELLRSLPASKVLTLEDEE